ncbi:meiosis 1 arrest protein-like [Corticium candelabrum]|uniref:meiosis 1 arrest protein-like n=1 Tax=Corticium candelabrum TaxID=121492 RepID=UPI002E262881|nr:meiosis 1 arrest protein-like [Corticium candelabrum]
MTEIRFPLSNEKTEDENGFQQTASYSDLFSARSVLVDMRPPFSSQTCDNLCESLQNVFSLVANLSGQCRVSFFCLFALANQPQCLYTLQHVKGSFTKLCQSIEALKPIVRTQIYKGCVGLAIEQSVVQFRRQMQTLAQTVDVSPQLEITLVTSQPCWTVQREVERATQDGKSESIKKITILRVHNNDQSDDHEVPESLQSQERDDITDCAVTDTVECAGDVLSFESFFKGWLHDGGSDREHLHLFLPSILSKKLVLKCDIRERLLNPADLPPQYQMHLSLQVGNSSAQHPLPTQRGKAVEKQLLQPNHDKLPHQLRAVRLIKIQSICESVLYGQPCLVRPTACWKLDWEELESNQQNFSALCSLLHKKTMALLVKEDEDGANGHFLLLPSDKFTLLLKSIAVSELFLPYDFHPTDSKPQEDAIRLIERSLNKLMVSDGYNPLMTSSGLYASLSTESIKSTPLTRPLKRKLSTSKPFTTSTPTQQHDSHQWPTFQPTTHRQPIKQLGMKPKKPSITSNEINKEDNDSYEGDPNLPVYKPYYKQYATKPKFLRKM